jgi:hypothetical protein
MNFLLKPVFLALLFAILSILGCAHSYYYTPEVAGDGAMSSKGGVVYSIPASGTPHYKMKVAYLGIADESVSSHFHKKEKTLRVRMYLLKKSDSKNAGFIDPKDEVLVLDSGGLKIHPAAVFARSTKRPLIELAQRQKQTADFLFALPEENKGTLEIQHFSFQWIIHYNAKNSETQTTRFDRQDSRPQGGAEMFPDDGLYPFYESPLLSPDPDWMMDDWDFWGY